MPRHFLVMLTLIAIGTGGYFAYGQYQQQRDRQQRYDSALQQLERLLADAYAPPDPSINASQKLKQYGCQDEWLQAPHSEAGRAKDIRRILDQDQELIAQLKLDPAASAQYSLAMLRLRGFDSQHAELKSVDPEQLLRRAASQGHGHANYYFARLLAEQYPHTESPTRPQDFAMFFEINKKLEAAADAGSGGAAYLLGFRTQTDVLEKFALTERDGNRRRATTSRTPTAWSCRSAELGYAPGIWQCYQLSQSRQSDARRLLLAAADAGHAAASALLAQFYAKGQLGLSKDPEKHKQLLCRASALGNRLALGQLARLQRSNTNLNRGTRKRHQPRQELNAASQNRTQKSQNTWHKNPAADAAKPKDDPGTIHVEGETKVKLVH